MIDTRERVDAGAIVTRPGFRGGETATRRITSSRTSWRDCSADSASCERIGVCADLHLTAFQAGHVRVVDPKDNDEVGGFSRVVATGATQTRHRGAAWGSVEKIVGRRRTCIVA